MTSLAPLLATLAEHGHDFRDYRHDVLARRVEERMAELGCAELGAYTEHVAADPAELARLAEALLISATAFFRDPVVFDALAREVLPRLAVTEPERTLRAWVAGAATGEEAWTLAMLLDHACAVAGRRFEIFASDRNAAALEAAATGVYAGERASEIPASYRERYVHERGGRLEITSALRARVRFCRHDLLGQALAPAEAVLARFDLVLCRNVLIYLEPRLQLRLVERLAAVLAPHGVLVLGPFETLPPGGARVLAPLGIDGLHGFGRAP